MRPEKISIVREIKEQLAASTYLFLADFTRMDTLKTMALRRKLRETGARFQVVPNRLLRVAARELNYPSLDAGLVGPTALIFGSGDAAATAKTLRDFIKANDKVPVVKLGQMEGQILSPAAVEALAALPPKPVIQSVLVGTLAAPLSKLVGVLNQKLATVVYVLQAALQKKNAA